MDGQNAMVQVATFGVEGSNRASNLAEEVRTSANSFQENDLQEEDVWISMREGSNLLSVSEAAVRKAIKAGKYRVKWAEGNGGKPYRIALSSLPDSAIKAYLSRLSPEQFNDIPAEFIERLSPALQVYWAERRAAVALPLQKEVARVWVDPHSLSEKERDCCLAWAAILKRYMETLDGVEWGKVMEAKRSFVARYNAGEWSELKKVVEEVSWQTLDRKLDEWRAANWDCFALAPRYRRARDRWAIERTTLSEEQRKILIRLALSPNAPAISRVIEAARREFIEKGLSVPSAMTCRRFLDAWRREKYNVWVMAREGEKALNDKVLPYIERNPDAIEVGDVIVMDGWKTDFDILNPRTGKPCRGVIITALDMRSNMVLGWEVMIAENVSAIAAALRRAMLRLGFAPRVIYIDNGKAFRAKFFQGVRDFKETAIEGLFERLKPFGFKGVTYAWAYHGQSKTVEPFHREYAAMAREMPTYRGNNPMAKPPRLNRGEKFHRRLYEDFVGGYAPTIEEVHYATAEWLDRYARRPQNGRYCAGRAPIEVFEESLARVKRSEGFEHRVVSKEALHYLMMAEERVAIFRNGIKFRGRWYYHDDLTLLEKGDKRYKILYDIEEADAIYVYREDGKFLCVAMPLEQAHPAAKLSVLSKDHEELARQIEMKRTLRSETIREAKELLAGEIDGIRRKVARLESDKKTGTDGDLGYEEIDDRTIRVGDKVIKIF